MPPKNWPDLSKLLMVPPNRTGEIRGPDSYAREGGAYGARRSFTKADGSIQHYRHQGVDYVNRPGDIGIWPCDGTGTRIGKPYRETIGARYHLIEIKPKGFEDSVLVRIFYCQPDRTDIPFRGFWAQPLGMAEDLTLRYPDPDGPGVRTEITNHFHVEVRVKGITIDPTPFFTDPDLVEACP